MNGTRDYPGFWHATLLCVMFVAFQMFFAVPFAILDVVLKLELTRHPGVLGGINLFAFAAVMMLGRLIGRSALPEIVPLRAISVQAIAGVFASGAGAIIVLSEVDNLVRLVLPVPEWLVELFNELISPSDRFWSSAFLLVIVAPVTEELLFRGLILRGFLRRFSVGRAFVLSSILFGAVHLNPWQFISATALGILFAWWYARTRSLIPCLIGHALFNAAVLTSPWLPIEIQGFNAGDPLTSTGLQPLWFDMLGILLLAAGVWLFHGAAPPTRRATPPPLSAPGAEVPPAIPTANQDRL